MAFISDDLDKRHRDRYWKLVSEHSHAVNAAVTGLSALPGTARPFAATRAMSRFLNHERHPLPRPDRARPGRRPRRPGPATGAVRSWSSTTGACSTSTRTSRSATAMSGRTTPTWVTSWAPPWSLTPTTAVRWGRWSSASAPPVGMLSTRIGGAALPPGHVDELEDVMAAAQWWGLGRAPIHVIDREADSVGHYRRWDAAGYRFVVRADRERVVRHEGRECKLGEVVAGLAGSLHRRARRGGPARGGHDPGRDRAGPRRRGGRGPAPAGAAPYRREDRRRQQEADRGPRPAAAVAAGGDAGGRRGRDGAGRVVAADERRRRGRRRGDDRPVVRLAMVDRVVS